MGPALPPDVLLHIFDTLVFDDLFRCTHVSRVWRSSACDHPGYWKRLVIDDSTMSPGGVALFLKRLAVRRDYSIYLTLRCYAVTEALTRSLLPTLMHHVNRVESLSLSISPAVATVIGRLLATPAPSLKSLHLGLERGIPAAIAVAIAPHTVLDSVSLIDVPVQCNLTPIAHVRALTVIYHHCQPQLRALMTWIPRADYLAIYALHSRSRLLLSDRDVPPTQCATRSANHYERIALCCADWRIALRALSPGNQAAYISILQRKPDALEVATILPDGDLCMCIRTQRHPREGGDAWGVVATTTVNRRFTRVFDCIDPAYMVSSPFLSAIVCADRLVILVVSLCAGFADMCERQVYLGRLRTLCIGTNILPEPPASRWRWGYVCCPSLAVLAFQKESQLHPAVISRHALDSFISNALRTAEACLLHVVLKDVRLTGPKTKVRGSAVASVVHRPPAEPWNSEMGLQTNMWLDGL